MNERHAIRFCISEHIIVGVLSSYLKKCRVLYHLPEAKTTNGIFPLSSQDIRPLFFRKLLDSIELKDPVTLPLEWRDPQSSWGNGCRIFNFPVIYIKYIFQMKVRSNPKPQDKQKLFSKWREAVTNYSKVDLFRTKGPFILNEKYFYRFFKLQREGWGLR